MRKGDIDLFNISEENQIKITELYQEATAYYRPLRYFSKKTYKLSHDIIYCEELDHFLILSNKILAKGSVGEVVSVIALLKNINSHWIAEKSEEYVVKVVKDYQIDCEDEMRFSKNISYLTMFESVNNNLIRYFIMKRISGDTLDNFIKSERFHKMTSLEKVFLCIALCQQLAEKIHSAGILHLDVKPKNILLKEKKKTDSSIYFFPRIIDFGISASYEERSSVTGLRGTPGYLAQSMFISQFDFASDIYALGVVFAQIFGHVLGDKEKDKNRKGLLSDRQFDLHFNNNELPQTCQRVLSLLIHQMIKDDLGEIPSLQDILILLQWIKLQLILPVIPMENHTSVMFANDVAQDVRPSLRHPSVDSREMKKLFFNAINAIDDNPYAISECLSVLNIKSIAYCKTKAEVKKSFNEIYSKYDTETINRLIEMQNVLDDLIKLDISFEINGYLELQQNKLSVQLSSLKLFPAKLDNIKKAEDKLVRLRYQSFIRNHDALHEALPKVIAIKVRLKMVSRQFSSESLRGKVVLAMNKYMDEALTKETFLRHDRAASNRRLQDMRDMLNLAQSNLDDEALRMRIKQRLDGKVFQTGFFGRSCLREEVLKAIRIHEIALDASATARVSTRP